MKSNSVLTIMFALVNIFASIFLYGLLFMAYWNDFLVPAANVSSLSLTHAIALAFFSSLILSKYTPKEPEKSSEEKLDEAIRRFAFILVKFFFFLAAHAILSSQL